MHDRGLGIHRQVFPAQQSDCLGMLFMDVFYRRYLILQVPVDAPGRIPGNHLQLPELLSQVNISAARKGQLDRPQDCFESSLSLIWLHAGLLDYRGDYGFLCCVRHRDLVRFVGWRLRSVAFFLNRHSTDQLRAALLRTVIV